MRLIMSTALSAYFSTPVRWLRVTNSSWMEPNSASEVTPPMPCWTCRSDCAALSLNRTSLLQRAAGKA